MRLCLFVCCCLFLFCLAVCLLLSTCITDLTCLHFRSDTLAQYHSSLAPKLIGALYKKKDVGLTEKRQETPLSVTHCRDVNSKERKERRKRDDNTQSVRFDTDER